MGEARQTSIWGGLRRRRVVRVAVAYIIGAWLLMQIGNTGFGLLDVSGWAGEALIIALVIGLPAALLLAWMFDISPEGLVATDASDASGAARFAAFPFSEPEAIDATRLRLVRPQLTELIGRTDECDTVWTALTAARDGAGGILLISGEPGVGKTRLGEEALEVGRELGMLPFVGHAREEHGAPFIIASEILEEIARTLPEDDLRNVLGNTAPEIARLLPELRRTFPTMPEPLELPAEQEQRYLFNAMLEFLTRLSRCGPIVMLLDDLHWADESSMLLLEHLAPHVSKLPLLMVVTYRDVAADMSEPFKHALARLNRLPFVSGIPLRELSQLDVTELLARLGGPNPPPQVVELIYHKTDGNAFFVQSVYQYLAEDGRLLDGEGCWLGDIDTETLFVPESVRLVIQRRIERLSEDTQTQLTLSAVLGLRFDPKITASASGITLGESLDSIEEAEAAKLILPGAGQRDTRYEFSHALVRQTLLERLSRLGKAHLHLKIAEAMERMFGDRSSSAADIAGHLYRAGDAADADKTIRFLELAADNAVNATASQEAVEHLEKALTILPADQELERAGLLLRCGSLRGSSETARADQDLHAALDIFRKYERSEEIAQIIMRLCFLFTDEGHVDQGLALCKEGLNVVGEEASSARCSLLSALGQTCALAADVTSSERWHAEALEMAESLGDPALLSGVLANRAVSQWQSFGAAGMVRDAGRAAELNRAGYRAWDLNNSLDYYALGLALMGRFAVARPVATETLEASIADGDTHSQMMCGLVLGMLHAASGDLQESLVSAQHAVEINDAHGLPWGGHFYGVLADFQMRAGDWDRALRSYRKSLATPVSGTCWDHGDLSYSLIGMANIAPSEFDAIWQQLRPVMPKTSRDLPAGQIQTLLAAVESLATLDRMDEVAEFYPQVRELADSGIFLQQFHTGLLEKSAGIAALAAGDFEASENRFRTALEQADDLPYATEQGEVRRWYAKMLLRRNAAGDTDLAQRLLAEAMDAYDRCGMPKHQAMAQQLRGQFTYLFR